VNLKHKGRPPTTLDPSYQTTPTMSYSCCHDTSYTLRHGRENVLTTDLSHRLSQDRHACTVHPTAL